MKVKPMLAPAVFGVAQSFAQGSVLVVEAQRGPQRRGQILQVDVHDVPAILRVAVLELEDVDVVGRGELCRRGSPQLGGIGGEERVVRLLLRPAARCPGPRRRGATACHRGGGDRLGALAEALLDADGRARGLLRLGHVLGRQLRVSAVGRRLGIRDGAADLHDPGLVVVDLLEAGLVLPGVERAFAARPQTAGLEMQRNLLGTLGQRLDLSAPDDQLALRLDHLEGNAQVVCRLLEQPIAFGSEKTLIAEVESNAEKPRDRDDEQWQLLLHGTPSG